MTRIGNIIQLLHFVVNYPKSIRLVAVVRLEEKAREQFAFAME